ncbi:MAG: ABC-F family ATP-binding cassette domain-containing protein, partial [Bacilli bacterium]|nr:ABC-F family ATP-binding cassette domain-containing protein [Bacilli bacterium]
MNKNQNFYSFVLERKIVMIDISFNKVSKNYGSNKVLEEISFDIKENEKVALVGINGCGKTTILNLIIGKENLNGGTISIRKDTTIGVLNQISPKCEDNFKVIDFLYQGIKEILDLKKKLELLEEKLTTTEGKELDNIILKYTKTQEKFSFLGGYEIDSMIGKITKVFKISDDMLNRDFNTLSGGEKTVVQLA